MFNVKPNNSNYHSGNYIPKNKDKVIRLNSKGGVYYRSGWELKIMKWLDMKSEVTKWGAECLQIPYQMTHFENGDSRLKSHIYNVDFYYEMRINGVLRQIVAEVKPMKEYKMAQALNEGRLEVPEKGSKKLKSFEYDLKMGYKNKQKWEMVIEWCNRKGYDFIIITEDTLKKFNL